MVEFDPKLDAYNFLLRRVDGLEYANNIRPTIRQKNAQELLAKARSLGVEGKELPQMQHMNQAKFYRLKGLVQAKVLERIDNYEA